MNVGMIKEKAKEVRIREKGVENNKRTERTRGKEGGRVRRRNIRDGRMEG